MLLQLDALDQNAPVNKMGQVLGSFTPVADQVSTDSLQPYRWVQGGDGGQVLWLSVVGAATFLFVPFEEGSPPTHPPTPMPPSPDLCYPATRCCCSEVFGLQRFRECELIHGRWAMLATLGALVQEGVTGDSWVAAQVRALGAGRRRVRHGGRGAGHGGGKLSAQACSCTSLPLDES